MTSETKLQIDLPDAQSTEELGRKLASVVSSKCVIALVGPLGAGKTTFAKGFAEGLGIQEVVSSPTFTMLNEYTTGKLPLYHLDLYRVRESSDPANEASDAYLEWMRSELEEISDSNGVILIEWANFMNGWIAQQDCISVELNYSTNENSTNDDNVELAEIGRKAYISAVGETSTRIVDALSKI